MALPTLRLRPFLAATLAAVSLALSGCGPIVNLGEQAPDDVFRLQPLQEQVATPPTPGWPLLIDEPSASNGLDSNRIAVMTSPLELRFLAKARWSQRIANMLQALMIDSFETGAGAMAMTFNSPAAEAPYVLAADIRDFQADVRDEKAPVVHVRIAFTLTSRAPTRVLAYKTIEATATATGNSGPELAEGFNTATQDVLKDLVTWTVAQLGPAS